MTPGRPILREPSNILLVDDQPAKLLTYETILEELGEKLLKVQSGREALEVLLHTDVALILLDVQMPELDGFDLAAMIRQHPRFVNTAIMFVSGVHLSDLDRLKGYSAGAVDYVPVPIIPELLRARVRVFVDLHRKTRELERLNRELEARVALRTADLEASTARLQESEERLRMALAAARSGAWEWQTHPDRLRWSPELFDLVGLDPDQPAPDTERFAVLVHPDDRLAVRSLFDSIATVPGAFELEFRVMRPSDDETVWIRTTGEVVRDATGATIARGMHQDVTTRKLAELALALEARRKDEFLATLAHELRNPLAPITNSVELLRNAPLDGLEREKALATVHRQVRHLARLVDDLLDVSRISRGDVTLRLEPMDLAAALRATIEARAPRLHGDHERVVVVTEPGPIVRGDPVRLAQVFDNLLDNAEKYTPAGGKIHVTLTVKGAMAEVAITDSGIGIPTHLLDEVFELFTQADRSSGRRGLGIGLAIVRQLVLLHEGTVEIRSDGPGTGTEVVVSLPCVVATPEATPETGARTGEVPSRRILVVDDNVDAADTTAIYLEYAGHVVLAVYGGEAALAQGESFAPEFVLLDLGMPVIDGYETLTRMRETAWGRSAHVFALSGWGAPEDRRKTARGGFDGHLLKPVDLQALLALFEEPR